MSGDGIPIESLLSKYLGPKDCRDLEEVLASPLTNKKKLTILQKIIRQSERNITPTNYSEYVEWLNQIVEKIYQLGTKLSDNNAFFGPNDNIREFVIKELNAAKKDIKICMFTISDNPIAETIAGCHKMGINVRIITDDGKIFDKGSDIYSLDRMGIRIKIDSFRSLMHHKFVLIDNKKLLTGSYNWTRSGADINNENVLITTDQTIVKAYKKEFKRLWKIMNPLPH